MNYELAKELKDNGFPFREVKVGDKLLNQPPFGEDTLGQLYPYFDFNPEGNPLIGAQHFFVPLLSELIEACGKNFYTLTLDLFPNQWTAYGAKDNLEKINSYICSTPEEAVARLWLALKR